MAAAEPLGPDASGGDLSAAEPIAATSHDARAGRARERALTVFALSVLGGALQIALLRELAAAQVLSTLGLSLRLVVVVVMSAYGVGAALAPWLETRGGLGNPRLRGALALAAGLYPLALLAALLGGLEASLGANSVDAWQLAALGVLLAPPFVAYGLVVAVLVAERHREAPAGTGPLVAVSIAGTIVGVVLAALAAAWIGVNSLVVACGLAALPALARRHLAALVVLVGVLALPLEAPLESLRRTRPAFHPPINAQNVELVYSGWSPHQKVDLYLFEKDVLLGFYNGFWQWWSASDSAHAHAFPGYRLLYEAAAVQDRDVLVIGSGAGMGLLQIEPLGPRTLTALELDPLVVELASGPFAAYNGDVHARVDVHAIDARAFLDATDARYDVMIYEGSFLTSAHPRVAVGAEAYLYTLEGVAAALSKLRPGGVGLVLFAGPMHALERVASSIEGAGAHVRAIELRYENTLWWQLPVLVFGRDERAVAGVAERALAHEAAGDRVRPLRVATDGVAPIDDAHPFLYIDNGAVLRPLLLATALGLAALGGLAAWPGGARRARAYYAALGFAAVVLQYGAIARLRSLLGDPVATSFTVLLVLLAGMALGAHFADRAERWRARRGALGWAAPFACVALACVLLWRPPFELGLTPWPLRVALVGLGLGPLGVLLGSLFPLGLRDLANRDVPRAYAWDALGSIVGFFAFHAIALSLGLGATLVAGAASYALAVVLLPARR